MAAPAPAEVKKIGVGELRSFLSDAGELSKGTAIFDGGGLVNLARVQHKLFCDAKGSAGSMYKVSLIYTDVPTPEFKARCTCPRRTFGSTFCKHAAALLVAWARAP